MATIRFKDGTKLNAEQNGNCYITYRKPDFPADLSVVRVNESGEETVLLNVKVLECASIDGRYWFTFAEVPKIDAWKASIEDALCELSMG